MNFLDRVKNAWNAFSNKYQDEIRILDRRNGGSNLQYRPYRYSKGSIIDTIINRIAVDVSMVEFKHVKIDGDPETEQEQKTGLNRCLTLEANVDQSYIDFIQDIVFSMMDEGVVAVVPVDTKFNPNLTNSYDILTMRVGKIKDWYPRAVRVSLYNDRSGDYEDVVVFKKNCAIIENPLFSIVNADNSTLKRLVRKLSLLDQFDEGLASNKLDLILQLPYVVKGDTKRQQAEARLNDITEQLRSNEYGITYIDGTEKITQLNRPVENSLLKEIEYLSNELFNQLGLTKSIFDGTASEQEIRSYYDRTINPIAKKISLEFSRKFLSDTARTQGHTITYHSNAFQLVPISTLASVADTLRRNAIVSTNEMRKIIGFPPSDDPRADELFNPNIADVNQDPGVGTPMAGLEGASEETVPPEDDAVYDEGML